MNLFHAHLVLRINLVERVKLDDVAITDRYSRICRVLEKIV